LSLPEASVLAAAVIAAAAMWMWHRGEAPPHRVWISAAAAAVAVAGWGAATAGAPAVGLLVAAAAMWSRPVGRGERAEWLWLLVTSGVWGLAVFFAGALVLPGLIVGVAGAWWVREAASGRLRGGDLLPTLRVHSYRCHVLVCVDKPCLARGAEAVRAALRADPRFRPSAGVRVTPSGCLGHCAEGPICWTEPEGTLARRVEPRRLDDLLTLSPGGRERW
jgi:hypothetical protein